MYLQHIDLEHAKSVLSPRMRAFTGALANSVNVWNSRFGGSQIVLDSTARAVVLNQYWYYFARSALANDLGVTLLTEQGQRYFVVDEEVILRFKLVDQNLKSKNFPTRRAKAWNLQLPLNGIPKWDRLEFGYRLDLTGTVVLDAFVILRVGHHFLWVWQVLGDRIETFAAQLPLTSVSLDELPVTFAYDDYGSVG